MLIVDAHLDLSMNALEWNRDLTQPVAAINAREAGLTDKPDRGRAVVSLPELRRGNVGLVVATQIARYVAPSNPLPGWHSPAQAWAQTQGQLAWYRAMEATGELVQITNRTTLNHHLARWADDATPADRKPIGYILSLEGADSLVTLGHLEQAYASGLRNQLSHTIGVVVPEVNDRFFSLAIDGIEEIGPRCRRRRLPVHRRRGRVRRGLGRQQWPDVEHGGARRSVDDHGGRGHARP